MLIERIFFILTVLVMLIVVAFLGWRVLRLMKKVKLLTDDWYKGLEAQKKLSDKLRLKGIEIDELNKERPEFSVLEKKMMLAALKMPEYRNAIEDPKTNFLVRKVYRNLKEKMKNSLKD